MLNKHFQLQYLPSFEDDLNDIVDYIAVKLHNPEAASDFLDDVEEAVKERLNHPLSFEPYPSARPRRHPYYRIYVKHYTIYYVVLDDIMEVRRIIYTPRDTPNQVL